MATVVEIVDKWLIHNITSAHHPCVWGWVQNCHNHWRPVMERVGVGRQRNALGLALGSFWLRYQHVRTMPITCEGVRVWGCVYTSPILPYLYLCVYLYNACRMLNKTSTICYSWLLTTQLYRMPPPLPFSPSSPPPSSHPPLFPLSVTCVKLKMSPKLPASRTALDTASSQEL